MLLQISGCRTQEKVWDLRHKEGLQKLRERIPEAYTVWQSGKNSRFIKKEPNIQEGLLLAGPGTGCSHMNLCVLVTSWLCL